METVAYTSSPHRGTIFALARHYHHRDFVRGLSLDASMIITAVALLTRVVAGIIPCKKVRGGCKRHSRAMLARRLTHLHAHKSGPIILAPARSLSIVLLFLVIILFADLIFNPIMYWAFGDCVVRSGTGGLGGLIDVHDRWGCKK